MATHKKTVDFKHPDYTANLGRWSFIDDICDARNLRAHLVKLNPSDVTKENTLRNEQVFKRAVFTAVAGYTSRGLIGKVFSKDPSVVVPETLKYIEHNIDGGGVSVVQQSQDALKETIRKGRCGLLVDMAATNGELSRADLEHHFGTVSLYSSEQIINWQTIKIGSRVIPSKIVLATTEKIVGSDEFSFEAVEVRLELKLSSMVGADNSSNLIYSIVEWRLDAAKKDEWIPISTVVPLDGKGQPLKEIPFMFVGSEANTTKIDTAPMYDICTVNAGHWNNSAAYEDMVFIVGQAQPWMSGLTEDMIALWKQENMYIGSGRLIGVPAGEEFGFAQAQPNTIAKEAMGDKIEMMVGLGAMMIQRGAVAKTATQSAGELLSQHSVLSLVAANVSEAYDDAFRWLALFMNAEDTADMKFEINQDFIDVEADAGVLREMVAGFMGGAIPAVDYHNWLKKVRLSDADKSLEDFQAELDPAVGLELDDE